MKVIGHRGAAGVAPENTVPSFEAAVAAGADGVELDVRLTADGRLVLMHDDHALRTTGVDARISSSSFEQVRAFDAAANTGWGASVQVPTLEEALAVAAGRVAVVVVEIKGWLAPDGSAFHPATDVAEAIVPVVRDVPGLVVSSFDPPAVSRAREVLPGVRTGLASYTPFDLDWALETALDLGADEVHVPEEKVDAAFVDRAHDAGIGVFAWTVNDPTRARAHASMGTDGVFTDDPAAMIAALR